MSTTEQIALYVTIAAGLAVLFEVVFVPYVWPLFSQVSS